VTTITAAASTFTDVVHKSGFFFSIESIILLVGRARRRCSDHDNITTRQCKRARASQPFTVFPSSSQPLARISAVDHFPADHRRPVRILRPLQPPHAARVFICVNNNNHRRSSVIPRPPLSPCRRCRCRTVAVRRRRCIRPSPWSSPWPSQWPSTRRSPPRSPTATQRSRSPASSASACRSTCASRAIPSTYPLGRCNDYVHNNTIVSGVQWRDIGRWVDRGR